MSRGMKLTLLAIALFFLLTAGSFLYFVATWDPEAEDPVVQFDLGTQTGNGDRA